MGVSVPRQPKTSSLRVFFFLYFCFCFTISTVFQAFFVSYLVEPNYAKKIETFDDLLNSDLVFGYHTVLNFAEETAPNPRYVKFFEQKIQKEDCTYKWCVGEMITKREMATSSNTFYVTYLARSLGIVDVGKLICSLDETLISFSLTILFKKGNPLLDRFNILMRRYLEAGLLEKLWTELQHRASLSVGGRFIDADGDIFFPFSVSHLMPAFVVLFVGTVLSSVVFIAELILNCVCKHKKKRNPPFRSVRMLC